MKNIEKFVRHIRKTYKNKREGLLALALGLGTTLITGNGTLLIFTVPAAIYLFALKEEIV